MRHNTLKRIGRMTFLITFLYLSNPSPTIAPESNKFFIESPKKIYGTRKIVVLDPGHGMGNRVYRLMDWGGTEYKDYKEAALVLEQAKKVKEMLNPNLYNVILTREDNKEEVSLESRPKLANKLNADIFISMHLNENPDEDLSGFEVYYRDDKSGNLARIAGKDFKEMTSLHKNLIKKEPYIVLDGLKCPGILVESAYLKKDLGYILDTVPHIEKAIVKTIEDYLNMQKSP